MIKDSKLDCRAALADLCNEQGLFEAVEVGVDRGDFANDFLERWLGKTLWCIDPFEPYPEMNYDRTADLIMAATRLAAFGWRAKIIRAKSPWAMQHIPRDCPIRFVYLDGDHSYRAIKLDIEEWSHRIVKPGILGGHDFAEATPDVVRAVEEFASKQNLTIYRVHDPVWAPSWYLQLK